MNCPTDIFLASLRESLPPFVLRKQLGTLTKGLLNPKTMANLDCAGTGIPGAVTIGRQVAYPMEEVIRFLESRIAPRKQKAQSMPCLPEGTSPSPPSVHHPLADSELQQPTLPPPRAPAMRSAGPLKYPVSPPPRPHHQREAHTSPQ